jgi:uncharacterized membrane protein
LPSGYTEDLVTIFPWFAIVLIGIFIVAMGCHLSPHLKANFISNKIAFLGRHSLIIYMIHQPILFGAILLLSKI